MERVGPFHLPGAFTIMHRFQVKGNPKEGTEREFHFRFQFDFRREPRSSWFSMELLNFFEARWFYFCVKLGRARCFKIVFNLGYRFTRESREVLEKQAMEAVIEQRRKAQPRVIRPWDRPNHDGGNRQWRNQKPTLRPA